MSNSTSIFHTALSKMLTPLVRIMLRNGVPFKEFAELAKRAYVQVAAEDFKIEGKRQTDSRISTLTGLTRKDVLRLRNDGNQSDTSTLTTEYNRAAKVISAWVKDPQYHDENGEPALLKETGEGQSFHSLVKSSSGDITARTILDELIRVEAVRFADNGMLELLTRAYIPNKNNIEKIKILGTDVSDLINTIDHNIYSESGDKYFQRKVCYNNLPKEVIAGLKIIIEQKAQAALEEMNKDMSACDRDSNQNIQGSGKKRAGIGIYYFEEDSEG